MGSARRGAGTWRGCSTSARTGSSGRGSGPILSPPRSSACSLPVPCCSGPTCTTCATKYYLEPRSTLPTNRCLRSFSCQLLPLSFFCTFIYVWNTMFTSPLPVVLESQDIIYVVISSATHEPLHISWYLR